MSIASSVVFQRVTLFLLIVFLPFQNTVFGLTSLGFLGKAPSFVFIVFLFVFSFLKFASVSGKVNKFKISFFLYLFFVSVLSTVFFWGDIVYGRNLVLKGVNLFILNILFLFPIFIPISFKNKIYKHAFFIAFILCVLGVFLGDFFHLSIIENGFFHMSERPSLRPRGFSYEPSMLAVTIFPILFSILCLNNKLKNFSFFYVAIFFMIAVLTSSKGAMATLVIAFFFAYFFSKKIISLQGVVFAVLFFVATYFLGVVLIKHAMLDMENNTSIATRSVCVLVSVFSLLKYPLGVGYAGFLYAFQNNVQSAIDFMIYLIPFELNFSEVSGYLNAHTDSSIGTKSFFFNNIIYFGWPFVFFFFGYVIYIIKECRKYKRIDLELSFLFIVISLVTFVEGVGLYPMSVFIAILNYELFKERTIIKNATLGQKYGLC